MERKVHFLECMDRVNRAIHQSDNVEQMLWTVLEVVHSIFDCDRVWLFYPCDPQSPTYRIPVEITRPEYPGAHALNLEVPMKPGGDLICARALATEGPVIYDADSDPPIFPELTEQFGVQSQMAIAIYPHVGQPWLFGMHQCSHRRVWSVEEQRLFEEIARRIGDGLSTLLLLRDLRESQERLEEIVEERTEELRRINADISRFQDLVETINDWVWEVDANGFYTYASPRVRDLLGYEPAEVVGKRPFDFMPEEEGKRVSKAFTKIVESRQPFHALVNRNRHKDGRLVVLETSGVPIFDALGNLVGYQGVDRDITRRMEMERERELLREESRRRMAVVEAIFEATQDGIAIYDSEGGILRLNAACEEMLGFSPEEQRLDIDQRWALLRVTKTDGTPLSPEEIPSKKALAGEKTRAILHFHPPRRPARWLSVSAAPIRSADVGPASAVTILSDITDFHALQQEHEIFMQMISHDLRTPITVIQGHAEMLDGRIREKDETTVLNLEAILTAARQMNGMMDDLLRIVQEQAGEIPLERERLNLLEYLPKLARRIAVSGLGDRLRIVLSPELPEVWADSEALERIISNLLTNALKYSPQDAEVTLRAENVAGEIRISVTDTGKGIDPRDIPHLFERFYRGRDTGTKKGVGLGLYITRKLVEAHGGRVWVESEIGKGSVFTFTLSLERGNLH